MSKEYLDIAIEKVVKQEINNIMAQLKDPSLPKEQQHVLLERFKEMKAAQTRLAKDCGDRVLK